MANKSLHPTLLTLVATMMLAAATACTNNNGDIGPWFGAWTLSAIDADGTPIDDYASGSITWKFQSSVVAMTYVGPFHEADNRFGTWRQLSASELELNFTHSGGNNEAETDLYKPFPATRLPAAVSVLQIRRFTSKHLLLDYTDPAGGTTYTYHLDR